MSWALIEHGKIAEIMGANPEGKYHQSLVFVPCTETQQVGDNWDGENFFRDEASIEDLKNNLFIRLISLCDTKQVEAERLLLGHKSTPKQLERYRDKYERAKAGEFSSEENSAIVLAHETIRDELRKFADMIEFFRQSVDKLIDDGELKKAEGVMEAAEGFDATTTQADIEQLLSSI